MVKAVRMVVAALTALACLAACNFDAGIFRSQLIAAEVSVDLSRYVDRDHLGQYYLQIIRDSNPVSGYPEYLVLANDSRSFGGDHLVIFDTDLNVLGNFTLEALDAMYPTYPYIGQGAMVDESGSIVVGNRRFTVASGAASYLDTLLPSPLALYYPGLTVWNAADRNLANIWANGQFLQFGRYNVGWGFITSESMQFSVGSGHQVIGTWLTDTAQVLLVVRHDPDPDSGHVLAMGDVAFATGGLGTPLLSQPFALAVPSSAQIGWKTLGYTNEGFSAFRWSDPPEYLRFSETGAILETSGSIPKEDWPRDQRHVYGRTAGWYVLDPDTATLERRQWWWK